MIKPNYGKKKKSGSNAKGNGLFSLEDIFHGQSKRQESLNRKKEQKKKQQLEARKRELQLLAQQKQAKAQRNLNKKQKITVSTKLKKDLLRERTAIWTAVANATSETKLIATEKAFNNYQKRLDKSKNPQPELENSNTTTEKKATKKPQVKSTAKNHESIIPQTTNNSVKSMSQQPKQQAQAHAQSQKHQPKQQYQQQQQTKYYQQSQHQQRQYHQHHQQQLSQQQQQTRYYQQPQPQQRQRQHHQQQLSQQQYYHQQHHQQQPHIPEFIPDNKWRKPLTNAWSKPMGSKEADSQINNSPNKPIKTIEKVPIATPTATIITKTQEPIKTIIPTKAKTIPLNKGVQNVSLKSNTQTTIPQHNNLKADKSLHASSSSSSNQPPSNSSIVSPIQQQQSNNKKPNDTFVKSSLRASAVEYVPPSWTPVPKTTVDALKTKTSSSEVSNMASSTATTTTAIATTTTTVSKKEASKKPPAPRLSKAASSFIPSDLKTRFDDSQTELPGPEPYPFTYKSEYEEYMEPVMNTLKTTFEIGRIVKETGATLDLSSTELPKVEGTQFEEDSAIHITLGDEMELPRAAMLKTIAPPSVNARFELKLSCDTTEVQDLLRPILKRLAEFQERNKLQAKPKPRFVNGMSQAKKQLMRDNVKLLIIPKGISPSDVLHARFQEIINLAEKRSVPICCAFSRRSLGNSINCQMRVSMVGIVSFEGCFEESSALLETFQDQFHDYPLARRIVHEMVALKPSKDFTGISDELYDPVNKVDFTEVLDRM